MSHCHVFVIVIVKREMVLHHLTDIKFLNFNKELTSY